MTHSGHPARSVLIITVHHTYRPRSSMSGSMWNACSHWACKRSCSARAVGLPSTIVDICVTRWTFECTRHSAPQYHTIDKQARGQRLKLEAYCIVNGILHQNHCSTRGATVPLARISPVFLLLALSSSFSPGLSDSQVLQGPIEDSHCVERCMHFSIIQLNVTNPVTPVHHLSMRPLPPYPNLSQIRSNG